MEIAINNETCIHCGFCVRECPAEIFEQAEPKGVIEVVAHKIKNCLLCAHCTSVCPTGSVQHSEFPAANIHKIDRKTLPTPDQVDLLLASRRSNRSFSKKPVPRETIDRIIRAANLAPTATNAQNLAYTVITDMKVVNEMTEFVIDTFMTIKNRLTSPLVKPWLKRIKPELFNYVPMFMKLEREYHEKGINHVTRGANTLIIIHAPKESGMKIEDSNLAYQNASLMAESLGISQVYMGFMMMSLQYGNMERALSILKIDENRRIGAIMAIGIPEIKYSSYTDRKPAEVTHITG